MLSQKKVPFTVLILTLLFHSYFYSIKDDMGGKRERVRSTILEREKSKDDGGIDGKIWLNCWQRFVQRV